MNLLLVEPDDSTRSELVEDLGEVHDVSTAGDGQEALQWVEANGPPEAVVIDLDLPDMRPLDLLTSLRVRSPEPMPVLFVSRTRRKLLRFSNEGPIVTEPFRASRVRAALEESKFFTDD